MNQFDPNYVRALVENEKLTIAQVQETLVQDLHRSGIFDTRGISIRSLKRFMSNHEIGQHRVNDHQLDELITRSKEMVGTMVGSRMMKGHIYATYGVNVHRHRVGRSLLRIDPEAADRRQRRVHNMTNPKPYHGRYFGYNLHMDQNEKLAMFGVTFVLAIDGHSGMIVGGATMVRKNNVVIYEKVYREIVQTYGLWDRVLVDHGREFYLVLYMQQKIHQGMGYLEWEDLDRCYRKMKSTKNNRIERVWVEINRCVSYPIKCCVADMFLNDLLDDARDDHVFAIGEVIRPVADLGLRNTVRMWNYTAKEGRGRPTNYVALSQTKPVDANWLIKWRRSR